MKKITQRTWKNKKLHLNKNTIITLNIKDLYTIKGGLRMVEAESTRPDCDTTFPTNTFGRFSNENNAIFDL
ncbi:hypothetical protein [Chitinophaga nivalis]|uniref:Uncharacterized protein n=1 Tax=Chitinophaga nivalis TaxID=2991709 RepID=A0ABT3IGV3_9BACT|nr:hypothetical protein [Chitinophaga nivalis]MCW3467133.1 hypothetical protein [Chitinophaga nivalis]MCW3483176.1 hypothetical protein [Chitinophaga nivalis]